MNWNDLITALLANNFDKTAPIRINIRDAEQEATIVDPVVRIETDVIVNSDIVTELVIDFRDF